MMATLIATGSWLMLASRNGWPVSTTHSIVGAIVGFVLITKGSGAVSWDKIFEIASSWITSPLISALLAFLIFKSVKMLIIDSKNRSKAAVNLIPIYVILVVFVILQVTFRKGLVHIGLVWENSEIIQYSLILSLVIGIVSFLYLRSRSSDFGSKAGIETAFSLLMVVAACAMAFAHGSNDVANAIGPLAAIASIASSGGVIESNATVSPLILLLGGVGIVTGLAMYGHKVIKTVGEKITKLTPSFGFSANIATASTVVFASYLGFPISTTHTLIGGVIGVGLANSVKEIDWRSVINIFMSWLITIPVGAIFTILFYVILRVLFGV